MPKKIAEKDFPLDLGDNVRGRVDDNLLYLAVDLSVQGTPSNSGKTNLLASTGGNRTVGTGAHEAKIGLNIYRKIAR